MPISTDSAAYVGLIAGLSTSVCWSISPLVFTAAARRLGVTTVNALRIGFAVVILGVTHRALFGHWLPEASGRQVAYLCASGVIGLCIGDQALIVSYLDIGVRLAALIMTAAPLFAALFGWLVLGEALRPIAWLGIALTVGGVAWVVLERPERGAGPRSPRWGRGIALALVGAACQAAGLLLSKQGMGHGWLSPEARMAPQAATLMRMLFAALGMLPIIACRYLQLRRSSAATAASTSAGSRTTGVLLAACGAVFGPFLGVWMSLVASDRAPLGVAQTLCSLPPVLILPLVAIVYRERISLRAGVGAAVAVAGTALLFLKA